MAFVLDGSVALSWYFGDEGNERADQLRGRLLDEEVLVPVLWPLEISNALLYAVRRERISATEIVSIIGDLRDLPTLIDHETHHRAWDNTLTLAQKHGLSIYDAAYLELALRKSIPLASLDRDLRSGAVAAGVPILPE